MVFPQGSYEVGEGETDFIPFFAAEIVIFPMTTTFIIF